jgi:hypothetical protein
MDCWGCPMHRRRFGCRLRPARSAWVREFRKVFYQLSCLAPIASRGRLPRMSSPSRSSEIDKPPVNRDVGPSEFAAEEVKWACSHSRFLALGFALRSVRHRSRRAVLAEPSPESGNRRRQRRGLPRSPRARIALPRREAKAHDQGSRARTWRCRRQSFETLVRIHSSIDPTATTPRAVRNCRGPCGESWLLFQCRNRRRERWSSSASARVGRMR